MWKQTFDNLPSKILHKLHLSVTCIWNEFCPWQKGSEKRDVCGYSWKSLAPGLWGLMSGWSPPSSAYSTEPCRQTHTPQHFHSVFYAHFNPLLTCVCVRQFPNEKWFHTMFPWIPTKGSANMLCAFSTGKSALVKLNWWENHVQDLEHDVMLFFFFRPVSGPLETSGGWGMCGDSVLPVMGSDLLWLSLSADVNGWKGRKAQPKRFCSRVETLTCFSFWLCRTCLWGIAAGGVSAY